MSIDEQHFVLPQTYGAAAYGRPGARLTGTERPFDPDELPLEAEQTDEERAFSSSLPPRAFAPGGVMLTRSEGSETSDGNPTAPSTLRLREIAGRILGGN